MSASQTKRTFYIWNALATTSVVTFLVWLLFLREGNPERSAAVALLPGLNASLNTICACLLVAAFRAIKNGHEKLHRNLMITAFCVSALFLLSYVYYHSIQGDTKFLGQGWVRPVYFVILISHILLSIGMLPLIFSSLFFGLTDKRKQHRRVARVTLPVWLYVSVTGVLIFFLLTYYSPI